MKSEEKKEDDDYDDYSSEECFEEDLNEMDDLGMKLKKNLKGEQLEMIQSVNKMVNRQVNISQNILNKIS